MQFTYQQTIGADNSIVKFETFGHVNIKDVLERLGGVMRTDDYLVWTFPLFVSSQVIKEVIHNTCFVCGGLMENSIALQNSLLSFNDFGNDAGSYGTTQSRIGVAKMINVRKCKDCGHSHT